MEWWATLRIDGHLRLDGLVLHVCWIRYMSGLLGFFLAPVFGFRARMVGRLFLEISYGRSAWRRAALSHTDKCGMIVRVSGTCMDNRPHNRDLAGEEPSQFPFRHPAGTSLLLWEFPQVGMYKTHRQHLLTIGLLGSMHDCMDYPPRVSLW
ncbi:hypothetical protein BJV78DRAFT_174376 [Lactifluus subvellereus]|nr:hypothetical protein BJV78DRAFT_174376 [Lactifluus subvellereus]